jgi:hypothetical protein
MTKIYVGLIGVYSNYHGHKETTRIKIKPKTQGK